MGALRGAPESRYPYLRSKGLGHSAVQASAIPHVVLCPAILFGPGDDFFPRLRFSLRFPIVPLPDGGTARFQPLHVPDLPLVLPPPLPPPLTRTSQLAAPQ